QRYARLALVRSLLATDDRSAATTAMDEMIALAGHDALPAKLYGPGVVELHAERTRALAEAEHGELVVECDTECAAIAGDTLVGCDGKCPDLSTDPNGPGACGRRLNTDLPGIVLLATGGAVFTGFTIAFGIGEARVAKARPSARRARPARSSPDRRTW